MGREAVRGMRRSVLRSNAWFSTDEPAVTNAIPNRARTRPRWKGLMPEASEPR